LICGVMTGLVHHRRTLTGVSGYAASRRLITSLHDLLLGTQGPVEFHATLGNSLAESSPHLASRGAPAHSMTAVRSTKTCTKRLRVLLSEDIEGLGKSGEVVLVASGYARNYLVPNRMARIQVEESRTYRTRYRGLSFAAMKHAQRGDQALAAPVAAMASTPSAATPGAASLAKEEMLIEHKKEVKKLENIVRKLTENPVVFKGLKSTNGVLEASIGPSEIRLATAKQLGIEIVDELIDMEGDVLDRPGDYLIPLKLEDTRSASRPKLNVRIVDV
jgi:ribosomal protein L9